MQPTLPLMKEKSKDTPEDFEEYMIWLSKLQETDPEAYERELFGENYFDEKQ